MRALLLFRWAGAEGLTLAIDLARADIKREIDSWSVADLDVTATIQNQSRDQARLSPIQHQSVTTLQPTHTTAMACHCPNLR